MIEAYGIIYWLSVSCVLGLWFALAIDRMINGKWVWQKQNKKHQ